MKTQLHCLSKTEQEHIHGLTLTFLAKEGIVLALGSLRRRLVSAGAETRGERVFFPADLVEKLVVTDNRKMKSPWKTAATNRGFTALVADEETGVFRHGTAKDVYRLCRLGNRLPGMDFISLPYTEDQEEAIIIAGKNSEKPILSPCPSLKALALMAECHSGCHCFLQRQKGVFEASLCQILEKAALDGIPLGIFPDDCGGGLSFKEKLLITNVHNITTAVIMKSLGRNNFVYYCGLRAYEGYSHESAFLNCAFGDMAAFYQLQALLFCDTDTGRNFSESEGFGKNIRHQSVQYAIPNALCAWLGSVNFGAAYSLTDLVLDNEVHAMTKGYTREFAADAEHLGVKVIKEVGPGGHFLFHPHTLKHLSHEIWRKEAKDSFLYGGGSFRKEAKTMVDTYLKP